MEKKNKCLNVIIGKILSPTLVNIKFETKLYIVSPLILQASFVE